jgi:hypothetical protein
VSWAVGPQKGDKPMPSNNSEQAIQKLPKTVSHGRIGEAAVTAKCWMNGIAAYNTGGLRANFAGSDLIINTADPKVKRLVQVKTGYCSSGGKVYLTQCKGETDLTEEKFVSDFVVFVNIDKKAGTSHKHDGSLRFEHLSFYVVPREAANKIYKTAVQRDYAIPLRAGGTRKLANMAVTVPGNEMSPYLEAWHLMR